MQFLNNIKDAPQCDTLIGKYFIDENEDELSFETILTKLELMPLEDLGALAAGLMARHLNIVKRLHNDHVKQLIIRMNPDVIKFWQPGETFFKRLKSADLENLLIEIAGKLPDTLPAKPKKAELVAKAVELAGPTGWLPRPLRTPCYAGPGSENWTTVSEDSAAEDAVEVKTLTIDEAVHDAEEVAHDAT